MNISNDLIQFQASDVNLLTPGTQKSLKIWFGDNLSVRDGLSKLVNDGIAEANASYRRRVKDKIDRLNPQQLATIQAELLAIVPDPA